jgi:glutamyl-tRNA synthetase/nondiscriminating glutamyl-tRNA synthetase
LTDEEIKEKLDSGAPYTIRLKVPENIDIEFEDQVR